jgi:hypothetical protein
LWNKEEVILEAPTLEEIEKKIPKKFINTLVPQKNRIFDFIPGEPSFSDMETFLITQSTTIKRHKSFRKIDLEFGNKIGQSKIRIWEWHPNNIGRIVGVLPPDYCLLNFLSNDPENK